MDDHAPHYILSEDDLLLLESYKAVVNAIGALLGDSCEVVLHSLHDLNHSLIYIHNGSKTGRKLGSPVTNKALELLDKCEREGTSNSEVYFTKNADNHIMRSTTTIIRNLEKKPIGIMCINFDISTPLIDFAALINDKNVVQNIEAEHFATDIDDLLTTTLNKVQTKIMADESIPQRQKIKEIIKTLNQQGVFKLRNSVPRIAKILDISRDVIYLHLRNQKHNDE